MKTKSRGQALTEFALILPLLLLLLFFIYEAARAFQVWNMVRNASEAAVRYAVTGQQDGGVSRLQSIKQRAVDSMTGGAGLPFSAVDTSSPYIHYDTPDALIIQVQGGQNGKLDDPGGPGERVRVQTCYNFRMLTPFFADRLYLRLCSTADMINEDFGMLLQSSEGAPPALAPIPTIGPAPIDILEPLYHGAKQVQGTGHPSRTVRLTDLGKLSDPVATPDPLVNLTTVVGADGSFVFDLTSIGKRLIGGHTIKVEGLSPYDTTPPDTAVVADPLPVAISEPLVQGDMVVTGTANPLEKVQLRDNGAIVMSVDVGTDGKFTFNLPTQNPPVLYKDDTIRVEGINGYSPFDEADVLAAVPIVINENPPLSSGSRVVEGWAKPGETLTITDLDDGGWAGNGSTTTVDAAGTFIFNLTARMQGTHRMRVTGYGESDTATVSPATPTPTPTPGPIEIDEPVQAGEVVVTGHAQPGATLRLRDIDDPTRTIVRTTVVKSDGTFSFDLHNEAPSGLTVGHVIVVQGYGTEDRATVQPAPSNSAYILLGATCQNATGSAAIVVKGFNWPINRGNILFFWDEDSSGDPRQLPLTVSPPKAQWEVTIDRFVNVGTHTIIAETAQKGGTAEATFTVPCAVVDRTNSPLDLTITQLSVVSTGPYTTYTPVTFNVVVSNPTTSPVNSLFWVDLFVDPSKQPITFNNLRTDDSKDYQAIGALGAKSSVTLTLQDTAGVITTGVHTYYALVDTFDQIPEFNEGNNVSPPAVITVTGVGTPPPPTPTPTPGTPTAPASISGITYVGSLEQGGVTVILYNLATGLPVGSATSGSKDALYLFANLQPGDYRLDATYSQGNKDYSGTATVTGLLAGENRIQSIVLICVAGCK